MTPALSQARPAVLPKTTASERLEHRDKNGIRIVTEDAFVEPETLTHEHDWNRLRAAQMPPETASSPSEPVLDASSLSGASLRRFSGLVAAAKAGKLPPLPDGGLPLSQGYSTDDPAGMVRTAWERMDGLFHARQNLWAEKRVLAGMTGGRARREGGEVQRRLERLMWDMVKLTAHLDAVVAWWNEGVAV